MALPTKATHRQTRVHNERLVVRTLYDFDDVAFLPKAHGDRLVGVLVLPEAGAAQGRTQRGVVNGDDAVVAARRVVREEELLVAERELEEHAAASVVGRIDTPRPTWRRSTGS